jgi:sarcosine oxidase
MVSPAHGYATTMSSDPSVAVVGAGIVGLSTAYALVERGLDVRVYEQGVPGNGQSGGESRIFRHAHDDPRLIEYARKSREAYERGGSIRTTAAIRALRGALGDGLVADEVLAVRPVAGEVEVRSGGRTDRYERVVVCAGRGTAHLARSVGLSLPVEQAAHVRLTFGVRGEPPARLATLQDSSGEFGETGVYAAAVPGNRGFGLGLSQTTPARDDGSLVVAGDLSDLARRASDYVRRALPGLDPEPVDVRHCFTTELPWSPDGVAVWEHEGLLFPVGHNLYKQAPGLGRKLAATVAGEDLPEALRPGSRLGFA